MARENGPRAGPPPLRTLFLVPVLLLGGVIGLFLSQDGAGLNVDRRSHRDASVERTVLRPGEIELHHPTPAAELTWRRCLQRRHLRPFNVAEARLPRLGSAELTHHYYRGSRERPTRSPSFPGNAVVFPVEIPVAARPATASTELWLASPQTAFEGISR